MLQELLIYKINRVSKKYFYKLLLRIFAIHVTWSSSLSWVDFLKGWKNSLLSISMKILVLCFQPISSMRVKFGLSTLSMIVFFMVSIYLAPECSLAGLQIQCGLVMSVIMSKVLIPKDVLYNELNTGSKLVLDWKINVPIWEGFISDHQIWRFLIVQETLTSDLEE